MKRMLLLLWLLCSPALAQSYTEGQLIEYLDYGKWEPGVYLYSTPSGQPVIRRKPNEFYPKGDTSAWEASKIRPRAAAPAQPARPEANPAPPAAATRPGAPPSVPPSGPPLSKTEVLGFLQANLGNAPFGPNRQQVQKDLAALIKARGLNFVFTPGDTFSQELDKVYAPDSTVRNPLWANSGPPPKQEEYFGRWNLNVNVSQHHSRDDRYRYTYDGGAKSGKLTINPDGSYVWNERRGTWRTAREDEKRDEGGAHIVLQKAKGGEDWVVYRNRQVGGNWIKVVNLREPAGLQEHGYR